jgi:hypothetical protein
MNLEFPAVFLIRVSIYGIHDYVIIHLEAISIDLGLNSGCGCVISDIACPRDSIEISETLYLEFSSQRWS